MNDRMRLIAIGAGVAVLVLIAAFAIKSSASVGNLDQGQVPYDPGVPYWQQKDPSKRHSEGVSRSAGGLPMGTYSPGQAGK